MGKRLIDKLRAWLESKREDELMRRFGGIQRCPWCRQWAQDGDGWKFESSDQDQQLDRLTCGVCSGTSLWLWGMGFHFVRPLDPPVPALSREAGHGG